MLFSKILALNDEINEAYIKEKEGYTIALLGNPNVGKSTVFNELTGMKQHTGNWPGKTVALASGHYAHNDMVNQMIDLPGTYSLLAHSSEEEVTRDYICFEKCDVCMVVCDSTCLERNLNLVLQTLEITNKVILVLNLMDEAKKKHIDVNVARLAKRLEVEVVCMSARNGVGFDEVKSAIERVGQRNNQQHIAQIDYGIELETAIEHIAKAITTHNYNPRFLALKLLDPNVNSQLFYDVIDNQDEIKELVKLEISYLKDKHVYEHYEDLIVEALNEKAKEISEECITFNNASYQERDMKIDRIVTSKGFGLLWMVVLLCVIFWITISGANVPSMILSDMFQHLELWMTNLFVDLGVNELVRGLLIDGIVRTCGWVIAVMLPPMAIFFPLFTLLEDFGYLPRIAFNLDGFFQKACTCGKQALTMWMVDKRV